VFEFSETLAKVIDVHRDNIGPFRNRRALLDVTTWVGSGKRCGWSYLAYPHRLPISSTPT
jgi:hypothetical protein